MEPRKMMGFVTPGDQRVPIPVRDWNAMKLALWRSRNGWEIAARAAAGILGQCLHAEDCPGEETEVAPCLPDCPDRELRMDALVILNAARMFAPIDARTPANGPYMAPSREYFSEVIAELSVAQLEIDSLREKLRAMGAEPPTPPPNPEPALLTRPSPQLTSAQFEATLEEAAQSPKETP